jgi:hypothetical protein
MRSELTLKSKYCKRHNVKNWAPFQLSNQWVEFMHKIIGTSDLRGSTDYDLKRRVYLAAPTEGQGKAAWSLWCIIKAYGWQQAKDDTTKSTFYRSMRILRDAGLGDADLSAGQVVPLRRENLTVGLCTGWDQIMAA